MERYDFGVRLTPAARELLGPDEALVLDWHRMAICCAGAGEMSLYAMKEEKAKGRRGLARLKGAPPGARENGPLDPKRGPRPRRLRPCSRSGHSRKSGRPPPRRGRSP